MSGPAMTAEQAKATALVLELGARTLGVAGLRDVPVLAEAVELWRAWLEEIRVPADRSVAPGVTDRGSSDVMTAAAASQRLAIPPRRVHRLLDRGELHPAGWDGGLRLVDAASVEDYERRSSAA